MELKIILPITLLSIFAFFSSFSILTYYLREMEEERIKREVLGFAFWKVLLLLYF